MHRSMIKLILFTTIVIAVGASLGGHPIPAAAQDSCEDAPPPQLTVGEMTRVSIDQDMGNNLRSGPSTDDDILNVLDIGEVSIVVSGPLCGEGHNWWQVRRWNGQTGWTVEGVEEEYWLEPWPFDDSSLAFGDKPTPDQGSIIFMTDSTPNTRRMIFMAADGTEIIDLLPPTITYIAWPSWSPDGKTVVFSYGVEPDHTEIGIVGKEWPFTPLTTLGSKAIQADWRETNRIVFAAAADGAMYDLYAINTDASGLANLTETPTVDESHPTYSPDGTLIAYTSSYEGQPGDIIIMDRGGLAVTALTETPEREWFPVWSPDGSQIAYYQESNGQVDLYIAENPDSFPAGAALPTPILLAQNVYILEGEYETGPIFSPDGERIAYVGAGTRGGVSELFSVRVDGTDRLQYTMDNSTINGLSWASNGEWLLFSSSRSGNLNLYAIRPSGANLAMLTDAPTDEFQAVWNQIGPAVPVAETVGNVTVPETQPEPVIPTAIPVDHSGTENLLLVYNPDEPIFSLINISPAPVNIAPLSFSGGGFNVSAGVWNSTNSAADLGHFGSGGCVQLWPYPEEVNTYVSECQTRHGWVSVPDSFFWKEGSFVVLYNGAQIATCDVAAGRCMIDLP